MSESGLRWVIFPSSFRFFLSLSPSLSLITVENDILTSLIRSKNSATNPSEASIEARHTILEEGNSDEKWLFGKIGSFAAGQLLKRYSMLGDGTFLVREVNIGGHAISLLYDEKVFHFKIKVKSTPNHDMYYLVESQIFESLLQLIIHYQTHPLICGARRFIFKQLVPRSETQTV